MSRLMIKRVKGYGIRNSLYSQCSTILRQAAGPHDSNYLFDEFIALMDREYAGNRDLSSRPA